MTPHYDDAALARLRASVTARANLHAIRRNAVARHLKDAIDSCDDPETREALTCLRQYHACLHDDPDPMEALADRMEGASLLLCRNLRDGAEWWCNSADMRGAAE